MVSNISGMGSLDDVDCLQLIEQITAHIVINKRTGNQQSNKNGCL